MSSQNFKNHTRLAPIYHFVLFTVLIAIIVLTIIILVKNYQANSDLTQSILLLMFNMAFIILFIIVRTFPLKAQDRAIRADENLRYFTLTGKLFDKQISIKQIIALRFAPDDELVELTDRALQENLSGRAIKQAIKNWRADNYRI